MIHRLLFPVRLLLWVVIVCTVIVPFLYWVITNKHYLIEGSDWVDI